MTVVALIPARGGSKRVPRKNLADCAGKPLLAWTAEAALASRALGRVVLSTDDPAIAAAGRRFGLELLERPAALADDDVPMAPVMQHAVAWLADAGEAVEALVLLQPSSPLRQADHIDEAVELFFETGAETVVSVVPAPHNFHPAKLLRIEDNRLKPYAEDKESASRTFYGRNGPAILINRPEVLARGERFGSSIAPYVMAPEDSVDIDEPFDLALAEFFLLRRERAVPQGPTS